MKKIIYLLSLIITISFAMPQETQASHYMGGEITWECLPSGQFQFTLKYYRECNGITYPNTLNLTSTSPVTSIPMSLLTNWPKDITPVCNPNPNFTHITCANVTQSNLGAVEEWVYKSSPVTISGVPPAGGWLFYHQSSARNPSTNVVGQPSWRLRAIMYPYNAQNTYPCFDNSPQFAEVARSVIDAGYSFTYNHNATDAELDSLTFEWGEPQMSGGGSLTYTAGYSWQNPLPGPAQNPNNVAAVVDPVTGNISFTSYTSGAFVTSTKVTAWKCGIKVAEIWRDIQVVLRANTNTNTPPVVTPPFNAGTSYQTVVYAGDLVTFNLSATDFQYLPTTPPSPQTMSIEATGLQFGNFIPPAGGNPATMSTTTGCLNPPCAKLTPAPGPGYPLTNVFGITTTFSWETNCSHLATNIGCGATSNTYNFVLKVSDDYCPFPASAIKTITIEVLSKPTLPSPEIRCVEVLPNGDVDLKWNKPNDPFNTFITYIVYGSNNYGGPYVELDTIKDIDSNFFTHNGANAQTAPMYYMVRTESGCNDTAKAIDIASTILLNVTNPMAGYANLDWNPTHNPLHPTSTGVYDIYREYPIGSWNYIGSTTDTNYIDTITICGDTINYRVHIADTLDFDTAGAPIMCESVSSVDNDYFADNSAPDVPIIDSVSVNPLTGNVYIGWNENAWDDTEKYIIHLDIAGTMTPIDSVYGKSNTSYIDSLNNACGTTFNTYSIIAVDSCGNRSAYSDPHNTIFLETIKDVCDDNITVIWNKYINMVSGLDRYELYVSENSGSINLLATLTPTDTFYEHINLTKDAQYCYFIRAFDNDGLRSSTSCTVCDIANKPNLPQFSYIQSASVLAANNGVEVRFLTDTTAFVSEYKIERGNGPGGPWTQIATVNPAPQATLSYTDYLAAVTTKDYYYRITVVDSCGEDAISSLPARTMFLQAEVQDSFQVYLNWNEYEGFSGAPTQYKIFRKVDGVLDPNPIVILPGTQSDYTDNLVSMMNSSQGTFHYYVYAYEGPGNMYNIPSDSARSNEVKAVQQPKVFIPTAFDPSSNINENNTFYPRGQFITSKQYLFQVYNRWGELIFETEELNDGWNGGYKGQAAPMGVYTYYFRFETASGELFEKRGTVTLLK